MSNIFVNIDGIEGEAKETKHQGWIQAIGAGYSVTQSAALATGGGGGVGKADFGALSFSHFYDRASPTLLKYCAAGKHVKTVVISVIKSGGNGKADEYIRITLSDCLITSVVPSGSADAQWTELVSVSYSKIHIDYKEQKADGTLKQSVCAGWNVKENREQG